jgi:hypothetical protein
MTKPTKPIMNQTMATPFAPVTSRSPNRARSSFCVDDCEPLPSDPPASCARVSVITPHDTKFSRAETENYWILQSHLPSTRHARLGKRPSFLDERGLRFNIGAPVKPWFDAPLEIALTGDDDGLLSDNLSSPGLPGLLVSPRFRAALEAAGVANIQYFAVNLTSRLNDGSSHPYFIANIVGLIRCVDFQRSDITLDPGPPTVVDSIDHLVLDETRIEGMDIFRLGELAGVIVISSRVKAEIERAQISGVVLRSVDRFVF